jgi:autotransporter-associated beta strand protein
MKRTGSNFHAKFSMLWHKSVAIFLTAAFAEQSSVAAVRQWQSLGAGTYNWEDGANWNGGIPGLADSANLRVNLTGNVIINLNGDRSLGAMIIGDSASSFFNYTITGGSNPNSILNLGNIAYDDQLEKTTSGTDTLDVLVNTLSLVRANLSSGTLIFNKGLTISGGNDQAFEKNGGGTATIRGPLTIASDSGFVGDANSSLRVFAGTMNVAGDGNVLSNGVFAGGGTTNFGGTTAGTYDTDFTTAIAGLRLQPNVGTNNVPVATTVNIGTNVASGVDASTVVNNTAIDIDQISIVGGTLNLRNGNSGGTTTLRAGSSGTLTLAGGTTTFATTSGNAAGTVLLPASAKLVLNGSATLNFSDTTANADYAFVALNASSSNTVLRSQAGNATLTIGGDSINDVFNGQLNFSGSGGSSRLIKIGSETLTLGGTLNNSTSRIEVQAGKLVLAKASSGATNAVGGSLVVGPGTITQLAGSHNSYGSTLAANYNDQIFRNAVVTLNGTGQLDLNGFTESFDVLLGTGVVTNTAAATASTLILGDNNFTVGGTSATRAFDGTLVDGAGTLGLTKSGSQVMTLNNGANTYTGVTTVTRGTLQLSSNGAITGTNEVRVNRNSTFLLNNSATAVGNRINNNATIVLDRGTFTLRGNSAAQSVTEVLGGLSLSGSNVVRIDHNSGANSAYAGGILRLAFANYTRNSGGHVAFVENSNDAAAGFQTNPLTSNSQITFVNNPLNDLVGGGGTGADSSILIGAFGGIRNNATNQLVTIVNSGGTFYVKPLVDSDYNTTFATGAGTASQAINVSNLPTSPVVLPGSTWNDVAGMVVANAQLTVNQHTAFNAFRFSQPTNLLILDDKRFMLGGMAANSNLGTTAFDGSGMLLFSSGASNLFGGTLDFGLREAILRVSGAATINSVVSGSAGLSKSGTSTLSLRGENTYTGNTWINEGEVSIFNSKALGAMGAANKVLVNVGNSLRLSGGISVGDGTVPGSKELYLIGDGSSLNADDRHNSWNGQVLLNATNEAGQTGLNNFIRASGDSILTLGGDVTTAAANPLLSLYETNPSFNAFGQGQTLIFENNVSGNGGSIINVNGKLSDRAGQPAAGTGLLAAEHEKLNLIVRGYTGVASATNSDFVVNIKDAASINGRLDIRSGSVFIGSDYGTGGRGDFVRGAQLRLNDGTNVDRAGSIATLLLTTPGTTFRGNDITIGENVGSYSSNSVALVGGLNRSGTVVMGSDIGVLTMTPLSGASSRSVASNGVVASGSNTIVLDTTNAINLRVGYGVSGPNIAPGTLVTAINGAVVTLSKVTTAAAPDNTSYTFGMLPVSNIQGASTNPAAIINDTKDIVLASVTNFAVGQGITGPGIPAGTKIDAVNTLTKTLTLSNATTAANTTIGSDYFSYNIGNTLTLSNVSGLRVGMGMTSGSGIPEGTYITAINGNTITLSAKINGAIEGDTNIAFPLSTVNYRSVSGATNKIIFNSVAGLAVGTIINHGNLPNGTTITAIDPLTNTVTVSNALTASIGAVDVSVQKPSNFSETRLYAAPGGTVDFRMRFLDETGFSLNNAIGAISKVGRGTVELSGSTSGGSNIDGGVNLFGGTLVFDYIDIQNDLGNDIELLRDNSRVSQGNVNSPYQLTLGGGSLLFRDGDAAGITENLRGTLTIRAGNSQIIGEAGNSSALLLNLGYNNPFLGGDSRYYWRSPDRFAGGTLQLEYGNLLDANNSNPLGGTVRVQYSQNATIGGFDGSIGSNTILPYATLKFNDPFLGEVVDFSSFNSEQVGAQTNTLFADSSGSIRAGNLFDSLATGNAVDVSSWDSALDYSFGGQYLGYVSDNYLGQQDPLGANGFQGTLSPNTLTNEFRGLRALRFVSNAADNTVNLGTTRLVMGSAHPNDAFLPGGGAVEDGGAILVSNLVSIDTSILPGNPTRIKPTDQFITGGQLTSAAGSTYFSQSVMPGAYTQDAKPAFTSTDLILHNYNEHGVFTISSQIVNFDTRPLNLVVSGNGVTKLAPVTSNTFTGAVFVNDATLWVANTSALGQSSSAMLYLNGGVLEFANLTEANRATSSVVQTITGRPLVLGGDGGTIKATASGSTITIGGVVRSEDNIIPLNLSENQMAGNVGVGDLIKTGAGRLILGNGVSVGSVGWNAYYGVTEVNEGTLQVNIGNVNSGILGSNASFLDGTLISAGARLDLQITGTEASGTREWFDLAGGTLGTTASHVDGVLDGVIRLSNNSVIDVKQGNLRLNQNAGTLEGAGRLTKTGDGTLMIYENNETFTGEVVVMNGLIQGMSQGTPFGKGTQITLGDNGALAIGTAGMLLQARTATGAAYRATYEIPQNILVRAEGGNLTQTKVLGVVNTGTALVAGGSQNDRYVFGGNINLLDDLVLRYSDDAANSGLNAASSTDGLRGGRRTIALNGSLSGSGNIQTEQIQSGGTVNGADSDQIVTYEIGGNNSGSWAGSLRMGNNVIDNDRQSVLRLTNAQGLGSANGVTLDYNSTIQVGGLSVTMGNLMVGLPSGNAIGNGVFVENAANQEGTLVVNQTIDESWDVLFRNGVTPTNYNGFGTAVRDNVLNLVKTGIGVATVTQANTYTGFTHVGSANANEGGTLRLAGGGAISSNSPITVFGGTFELQGTSHTANQVLTLGGGASGTKAAIRTGAGTLTLGAGSNIAFDGSNGNAGAEVSGTVQMGSTARIFTVADSIGAAIDLDVKATLLGSSTGPLIKTGAGTLALSGNNTFSGGVTINQGTLLANNTSGSATGGGVVTVNPGGVLGGTGTITGDITLSNGVDGPDSGRAIISPGSPAISSGIELLNLQGSVTIGENALIDFYLGQTGFTQLNFVTLGNFPATTKFRINLEPMYTPSAGATFDLINWDTFANTGDTNWIDNLILPVGPVWDSSLFSTSGVLKVAGSTTQVSIISEPAALVTVDPGAPASFSVVLSGTEPWLLQWRKGGIDIPGATGLSYTIPAAVETDEGVYSVVITNGGTPVVSANSTLVVNDTPQITVQPVASTVVNPGANVSLTVTAQGATTYTWRRNGQTVQTGPSSTLALSAVTEVNQGTYVVEVSNLAGSVFSSDAVIEVNDAVVILTQPEGFQVPQGTVVTFSVAVVGTGPFTYEWFRGATPVGTNAPTLQMTAGATTWGNYTVRVTNVVGPVTSNIAALVEVGGQVNIVTHPTPQIVPVGGTLTLSCVATGGLPLKYQWRMNGRNISGATSATFVATNVAATRAGSYSCFVSNVIGTGATSATSNSVDVAVVNTASRKLVLREGTSTTLSVTASGNVRYQWYKNDGTGETLLSGAEARTLSLPSLMVADKANYYCRVKLATAELTLDGGMNDLTVFNAVPDINMTGHFTSTIISEPYSFQVPLAEGLNPPAPDPARTPTKWAATGLPPGLTINSEGLVSGRATAVRFGADKITPIAYLVRITASNSVGSDFVADRELLVQPLPGGVVGVFTGRVARAPALTPPATGFIGTNFGLGGRIDVTTTTRGTYSGKLLLGATTYSFKGALNTNALSPNQSTATTTIARSKMTPLTLSFTLDAVDNLLKLGSVTDGATTAAIDGWRSTWVKTSLVPLPASAYQGYYTFALDIPNSLNGTATHPNIPQGTGYGSFTVAGATGKLSVAGRLSDGTSYTSATFVGPTGQILIFRTLYAANARGSVLGQLNVTLGGSNDLNTLAGTVNWWRPATPGTSGRTYAAGFDPMDLTGVGSRYTPPVSPNVVMNINGLLPANTANSRVNLVEANVESALPVPSFVDFNVNPTHKALAVSSNGRGVTLTITPRTGVITGGFRLSQAHPDAVNGGTPAVINRTVSYLGLIVKDGLGEQGIGYFMLPQLPTSAAQSNTRTPILSGQVTFTKLP